LFIVPLCAVDCRKFCKMMLGQHAQRIDNQFRERQEVDVKLENCCVLLWVKPEQMPCEMIDYQY
jgi:hypothetical protein